MEGSTCVVSACFWDSGFLRAKGANKNLFRLKIVLRSFFSSAGLL